MGQYVAIRLVKAKPMDLATFIETMTGEPADIPDNKEGFIIQEDGYEDWKDAETFKAYFIKVDELKGGNLISTFYGLEN